MAGYIASLEAMVFDREQLQQLTSLEKLKKHLSAQAPQWASLAEEGVWVPVVEGLLQAGYGDKDVQALIADINYLGLEAFLKDMKFSNPRQKANVTRLVSGLSMTTTGARADAVRWDDIGGLGAHKRSLQEMILYPLEHPEKFAEFGRRACKSVLLFGPPGCGKTLLAKAVATEIDADFVNISSPEVLTQWCDASAKSRTVLFFSELESISSSNFRMQGEEDHESLSKVHRLIHCLKWMDNIFFIGATTRPWLLDDTLKPGGRGRHFDNSFFVPLPDRPARRAIFESQLRRVPVAPDVSLSFLASSTDGFTGKELAVLCQRAIKAATRDGMMASTGAKKFKANEDGTDSTTRNEVGRKHFELAFVDAERTASLSDLAKYEQFRTSAEWITSISENRAPIDWPDTASNDGEDDEDLYS